MLCDKRFWQHFMTALAAVSSIATLISFLSKWDEHKLSNLSLELLSLGIIGVCLIYAMIMMIEKSRIRLSLKPRFEITIEKGDLFRKSGVIVIPVNEYFDTIVNDIIISPTSLHGKWITKYWSGRIAELDDLITKELDKTTEGVIVDRKVGKMNKYELGTCISIRVPDDDNIYVLFALTHFDKDNHAYLEHTEFPIVLDKLLAYLENLGTDRRIYMPLFGTGLSRLNRSPQRILTFMLDAMDFKHSNLSFPHGLYIELYSLNNINLNQIEDIFLSNIHQA